MSNTTMSFALPNALRTYIEVRVRSGQYGNTSEYLRELITEGLESGPARALTPEVVVDLKRRALGR